MLDMMPDEEEMTALVGKSLYDVWNKLCALIDEKYIDYMNSYNQLYLKNDQICQNHFFSGFFCYSKW